MSGETLQPSYCEDQSYPAYADRLALKGLTQQGVDRGTSFQVTAGSGLQVNVAGGFAFVPQTNTIEPSAFYNGLYCVPMKTPTNPYNSVEVSSSNPQIAQIILRVYDIGELKTSGSSKGRIEWLNGTPNAGATKAHIEEGFASEYGAAELPTSSLRLAYVLIPTSASSSAAFTIVDARRLSGISKGESSPEGLVEHSLNTEYEPSKIQKTFVSIKVESATSTAMACQVKCGGLEIAGYQTASIVGGNTYWSYGFPCGPTEKWKVESSNVHKLWACYTPQ